MSDDGEETVTRLRDQIATLDDARPDDLGEMRRDADAPEEEEEDVDMDTEALPDERGYPETDHDIPEMMEDPARALEEHREIQDDTDQMPGVDQQGQVVLGGIS